ncbi:hypothetical protein JHK87_027466 [Glycine soja]|nr:hypothetical protein JHK87_027466 [Glycine soja]
MAWQYSPLVDVSGPHILVARVSTKGSCVEATANAITEEPFAVDVTTMGLYIVGEECTQLVALGKLFDSGATIHHGISWSTNDKIQQANYFGSLTQASAIRVNPDDIVFGGWDINNMNLADAMARAKVFDINLQKQLRPYMESMLPFPKIYDPNFIATN